MTPWTYYFRWAVFFVVVLIAARWFLVRPIVQAIERLIASKGAM